MLTMKYMKKMSAKEKKCVVNEMTTYSVNRKRRRTAKENGISMAGTHCGDGALKKLLVDKQGAIVSRTNRRRNISKTPPAKKTKRQVQSLLVHMPLCSCLLCSYALVLLCSISFIYLYIMGIELFYAYNLQTCVLVLYALTL
jgi:hypothetical protein